MARGRPACCWQAGRNQDTPGSPALPYSALKRRGRKEKVLHSTLLDRTGEHKDFFLTNSVFASISWAVPGSIQPQVGKRSILPTLDFMSAFHFIQNFTSVWVFSRPYKNCQTILENNVKRGQGFFFFFLGGGQGFYRNLAGFRQNKQPLGSDLPSCSSPWRVRHRVLAS